MIGLGQAEREMVLPRDDAVNIFALLGRGEPVEDRDQREVADHRRFILQIVGELQPLPGHMFANRRDHQIGGAPAATFLRQAEPQETRFVGAPFHLSDQIVPLVTWLSVAIPIGSRVFAAIVEELDVLALEWLDLAVVERIDLGELVDNLLRQREIHHRPL